MNILTSVYWGLWMSMQNKRVLSSPQSLLFLEYKRDKQALQTERVDVLSEKD